MNSGAAALRRPAADAGEEGEGEEGSGTSSCAMEIGEGIGEGRRVSQFAFACCGRKRREEQIGRAHV